MAEQLLYSTVKNWKVIIGLNKKRMHKKNKASALILSLIILFAITIIGLSLALTSVRDRQASMGSAKSNQAFQEAETGIETVMAEIKNDYSPNPDTAAVSGISGWDSTDNIVEGSNWEVELKDVNDGKITSGSTLISEVSKIKSTGWNSTTGEKRAIEAAVILPITPVL